MPNKKPDIKDRKLEHIKIVLEEDVEPTPSSFDEYKLLYKALPEIDMSDISTEIEFFEKKLSFPFVISSMTGGPDKGLTINRNLAEAAEEVGVGLGLGSMRVIISKPESVDSFNVRKYCPSIPLFANVGIVQLNYGFGADEINRLIDSVEADGIFFHVNPLQEAVQPEGDTNFKNLIPKLEKLISKVNKPIIIKEVGTGIDSETARRLAEIGIEWIDVSGTGGTSWSWVEGYRRQDNLGHLFKAEGIKTADALQAAREIKGLNLISGGGVRSGIDIAKSIALGAKLATAAKPLLQAALEDTEKCIEILKSFKRELRVAMFMTGVTTLVELGNIKLEASE